MKKKIGSIYHWVDCLCIIRYSKDTGHIKDQIRFDLGHYLTREQAEQRQRDLIKAAYPSLSDRQIDYKIIQIDSCK